jgi:hypothetical protein
MSKTVTPFHRKKTCPGLISAKRKPNSRFFDNPLFCKLKIKIYNEEEGIRLPEEVPFCG